MMKFLLSLACAATLSVGLQAQISGSINRGAPKITNSIEMGGNKLHLEYTSIRFGDGAWQGIKDNADRHERFNQFAEQRPIGMVETSCDLETAGKMVPAGKYKMFFTVNAQAGWILNLKSEGGDAIRWAHGHEGRAAEGHVPQDVARAFRQERHLLALDRVR